CGVREADPKKPGDPGQIMPGILRPDTDRGVGPLVSSVAGQVDALEVSDPVGGTRGPGMYFDPGPFLERPLPRDLEDHSVRLRNIGRAGHANLLEGLDGVLTPALDRDLSQGVVGRILGAGGVQSLAEGEHEAGLAPGIARGLGLDELRRVAWGGA